MYIKRKFFPIMCVGALTMLMLAGCSNSVESVSEVVVDVIEETETPHEHSFTETITKEATCMEAGEKTLVCECGESSVEEVPSTGHDFSNYVSNEDATYEADGTETATCGCGETDTRVAEGSMLTYSFEEMDGTKYAKSTVNVRSLPNSDGEKVGNLSTNDEVNVTGKCNETGWYRIEYADGFAYVSDEYVVDEKVEAQASAPVQEASTSNVDRTFEEVLAYASSKYPMYQLIDNGDGTFLIYSIHSHGPAFPANAPDASQIMLNAALGRGYSGFSTTGDRVEFLRGADGYGQWSIMYQIVTFT